MSVFTLSGKRWATSYLRRGMLEFSKPQLALAVYWLRIPATDGPGAAYIGQTDNLPRRFGNHRSPGPSQRTSLGINAMLTSVLVQTRSIEVLVALQGELRVGGRRIALDMHSKFHRLLTEASTIVTAQSQGVMLANR